MSRIVTLFVLEETYCFREGGILEEKNIGVVIVNHYLNKIKCLDQIGS